MELLTPDQINHYRRSGYLTVPDRIPPETIEALRVEVAQFEVLARGMQRSDGRIDLEDSHTPEAPRIRRIKRPDLISPVVQSLMRSDAILAPVRDLLGPDIRLHTTKLNMKKAGYGAAVEWHQDFAFYPHTNDDVLAIGITLDDIGAENGPLMVFPGTHQGPIFDHHEGGVFHGAMNLAAAGLDPADAVPLHVKAGSITIHHGRIVHGSALNRSDRDRRLLFIEAMAADAFPIMGAMTRFEDISEYDALMLCGRPTLTPRLAQVPVRIPQPQPAAHGSIYEIQSGHRARSFETSE
ncbi:MAG: phytanoyl-CoA dioxygenase family protein [Pseudomonadota bacterium]